MHTSNERNESPTAMLLLAQDAAAARASDIAAGLLGRIPAAPHGNIQVVIDDKIRWGHIVTRMCEDS